MRLRKLAAAAIAVAAALLPSGASAVEEGGWIDATFDALEVHFRGHPKAEAQDVYKFLFQAVLGPGHAIPSREAAASYLDAEVENLALVNASDPMCEPLGGTPAMVRIHLRPFLAENRDRAALLDAFVASAGKVVIDRQRFERILAAAPRRLEKLDRHSLAADLLLLAEQMRTRGFPALHHSAAFAEAYGPAYRVVLESEAHARGWCGFPSAVGTP